MVGVGVDQLSTALQLRLLRLLRGGVVTAVWLLAPGTVAAGVGAGAFDLALLARIASIGDAGSVAPSCSGLMHSLQYNG